MFFNCLTGKFRLEFHGVKVTSDAGLMENIMFFERLTAKCQSIVTISTMLTIVVALTPFPCLAVVHGDVELLKTVALQHKANFGSLATWKGEAFEEMLSTRGDDYDYLLRNKCIFAYDQLQNAARWNKQPQENRFVVEGKNLRDINALYNSAMVKDQSCYRYTALGLRDGKETYHLIIAERKQARDWENVAFDPRYFFCDPGGGGPIHDRLMFLYDNATNIELGFEWYVKRVGDLVTLEVSFGENNANTEKYVFDLSVRGNLLEYYNKTPGAENGREFKYEEKSAVWVPKSFKMMNITHREDGDLRTTRSIHWSNSVVNVPFEEDEFTLEKLRVKHGDDIHDRTIGIRYKYYGTLKVLDKADMPKETDVAANYARCQKRNERETLKKKQHTLENTPSKRATDGERTPVYVIVLVLVIGLAGIAYMLTRNFRKE
jgi:hypothetical protein